MSIIRGIGKFVGGTVFVFCLSLAILIMGLENLTEYDNLKGVTSNLIQSQIATSIPNEQLKQLHGVFLEECKKNEEIQLPFFTDRNITVDCKDIKETDPNSLGIAISNGLFNEIYYKKYDCGLIECLKKPETLTVLVSSQANASLGNFKILFLVGSMIGWGLMLISITTWDNRLKSTGTCLISIALPFVILNYLKSYLLPIEIPAMVKPLIDQLFSFISNIFLIILICGIVFIVTGYVLGHRRKKLKK